MKEYFLETFSSSASVRGTGAELCAFKAGGIDYIWHGDGAYWSGRAPVLFPSVGTLRNNRTFIHGRRFEMQKHGFARKCDFVPLSTEQTKAVFFLRSNEKTLAEYPFHFELYVTHTLFGDGFKTEYLVRNIDRCEIFYGIGGHPAFNCPLFPETRFSDYTIEFETTEPGLLYSPSIDVSGAVSAKRDLGAVFESRQKIRLDYSLFVPDALILENLRSKQIRLVCDSAAGLGISGVRGVSLRIEGFTMLGIWTPAGRHAPFVCLEPWTAMSDHLQDPAEFSGKAGIQFLNPGEEKIYSYEMKILKEGP